MRENRTYTHASTGVQEVSRHTDAFEASVIIDAQSIQADVPDQTLVLICERMVTICESGNTLYFKEKVLQSSSLPLH